MLEDLWPGIAEFEQVNVRIEEKKKLQSQSNDEEETGSVQFAKKRAEKLRIKEEKEREARERIAAEQIAADLNAHNDLPSHEWLVE